MQLFKFYDKGAKDYDYTSLCANVNATQDFNALRSCYAPDTTEEVTESQFGVDSTKVYVKSCALAN